MSKPHNRRKPASVRRTLGALRRHRLPGQLVIQFTDHCNARCPQCSMRVSEPFPRTKLAEDEVKRIIDAAAEQGFRVVSFTGGEPLLFLDELAALIRHAGRAGIEYIRTGTNGFPLMGAHKPGFEARVSRVAETLAGTPLRNFWISLDSAEPAVHEGMRGLPGVVAGIEKALPVFHRCGIYPSANLGINRNVGGEETSRLTAAGAGGAMGATRVEDAWRSDDGREGAFYHGFRNAFGRFYRFVIDLGFTLVNSCYPMSLDQEPDQAELSAVYAATSTAAIVRFTRTEKALLYRALMDAIPQYRSRIRIFSPRTSLHALWDQYRGTEGGLSYPCRGGIDFFFVDSRDGNTYPCGYRGHENLGRLWELDCGDVDAATDCRLCDWECFRDPSDLFGPLLHGLTDPLSLARGWFRNRDRLRLWLEDLRYYRACGWFDGRRPPDRRRLARFAGGHVMPRG